MLKNALVILCSLGLLVSNSLSAAIQSTTAPISQYMTSNEPLMLRHADGKYNFSVPISDRVEPLSATLSLALTNSNLLQGNRSQIAVFVNDYVVGQLKLDPVNNHTLAKFEIDREYLKPGYNKISFIAAQHYTESECEDWSAPELWTHIDTVKSTFTLNYEAAEVRETLAALNELINDRVGSYPLTILRGDTAISDHYLYWGALIGQAAKLRLKYVPLQLEEKSITASGDNSQGFAIDPEQLKNDAILVGSKAQIGNLIPPKISEAIQGPYLGIFRQDHDKTHFILVVSGNNDEQVTAAAQALALLNGRFPDQQQSVFQAPLLPSDASLLAPGVVTPGNAYQFKQLAYLDQLQETGEASLELRLPADLYSTEDSRVTLNLNLAYGAAMRNDSVINIDLNDTFVNAIHLKEAEGAHYQNYQITLPLRSFRPGLNRLKFKAELTPSVSGQCTYVQRNNLVAQLYPDSTISFPEAGHVAQLPDLKLFADTGFPLAQNASAKATVFKLLDTSSDSIAATWQLIATLAAQQQTPLFDIRITQGDMPDADNVVLIGKLGGIAQAEKLFADAPVKLGESTRFPYSFKQQHQASEESMLERLDRLFFGNAPKPEPVQISQANVALSQTGGLGEQFLLMSYPHAKGNGVVLALLGGDHNSLSQGLRVLESPALWNQLQGNVFLWDNQAHFDWQREGATMTLGDGNLRLTLTMHFSKHPWQWLFIVVLTLVLAAWVTHKLLNQYQRSKH